MLSTAVMAAFGFVFWLVNARFYSAEQIGLATTLISVASFITNFSMLGFNNSLVRFLPTSNNKNEKINTGFTLIIIATVILSLGFIIGLPYFSPRLMFLREHIVFEILFVLFMVFASLNSIVDTVFVAYRSSVYVLIKNTLWSILKLSLPLFFIYLGAWGIFSSISIATIVAALFSVLVLVKKFAYRPGLRVSREVVKKLGTYSTGNYIAGIIGGLPTMILPVMITNRLGPEMAAYYYMPMMIANLLYIIPQATARSFFAEGSYSESNLRSYYTSYVRINILLLVPAAILLYSFGYQILSLFGLRYATGGYGLLKLLLITSILIVINSLGTAILNINRRISKLVFINLLFASLLLILINTLNTNDLIGVGTSWLFSHFLVSGVYIFIFRKLSM
jgi:O-antigen/teichoic acid export membrane protein